MLSGLLLWGALYIGTATAIWFTCSAGKIIPAYFIFEMVCLAPFTVWLFLLAARKGRAVVTGVLLETCVVAAVTYTVQVLATLSGFWAYFQDKDALLGPTISGVPVEEFLFYPLTINFSMLLYLWICDYIKSRRLPDINYSRRTLGLICIGFSVAFALLAACVFTLRSPAQVQPALKFWTQSGIPRYLEGPRQYNWTLICLISIAVNAVVFYLAELKTSLMLRAALILAGIFFLICLLVNLLGTGRGWWVYNGQQTSGIWIGGVPLEDLAVCLTGVTLPISIFEATRTMLGEKGLP